MSRYKDFQEATARRIFQLYKDEHRRVLLADEVGLGKTFVARRVIDLVRAWHKEMGDNFFRVVYICSNANIAGQNLKKLKVENPMSISESRLSMQHLYIEQKSKEIIDRAQGMPETIIPLTPSTSFRFYSTQGTANERALMFDLLKRMPEFMGLSDKLGRFLSCGVKNWEWLAATYDNIIQTKCGPDYVANTTGELRKKCTGNEMARLAALARTECSWRDKAVIINTFRRLFAEISVDKLDPDLVIMDEFQRFSSLLEQGEDEQSMLTRRFFDPTHTNTKILLLSATPYKPYTTLEELNAEGRDEHREDFMKIMNFLFVTKEDADRFARIWQHWSDTLKCSEVKDIAPLMEAKDEAQDELYRVMCRSERFNTGIIDDSNVKDIPITVKDITSYAECQNLIRVLSEAKPGKKIGNVPIEYVKSSPYLLSFMDRYELKRHIADAMGGSLPVGVGKVSSLLLSRSAINLYKQIDPANGKLKFLHDFVFGEKNHENKKHLLLWVPASNPYYKAGGLFETESARDFSKILLFSAWEMVPRMVSVMMSYYAELYTIGQVKNGKLRNDGQQIRYFSYQEGEEEGNGRKRRYGTNRLRKNGPLDYPCHALASFYDPRECFGQRLREIKRSVAAKVRTAIAQNDRLSALPRRGRQSARCILAIMELLDGHEPSEMQEGELYVPDNADEVLTDIAIASPAVCAYRQSRDNEDARQVAAAMVRLFNKPECAAVVDLVYNKRNEDDYYESVLDYCAQGNLQAVLDEYAHTLDTNKIGSAIMDAILPTTSLRIDTSESLAGQGEKANMHCHFAIPFIDKAVTDKSVIRTKNLREAFNSPFRPFILSTTSVGQEGLDFHCYSSRIVHWNLPSNPVDLEQREGRINRFECLAIRRNVARLYGTDAYHTWDELFNIAKATLKGNHSDLVPYWCLPIGELTDEQRGKLAYIERIVPLYPFSRDRYKYEHLIKVLSLYRMTLGQPRQEELLELLKAMELSEEQLKRLTMDLCPFHKVKQNNEY